MTPLRSALYKLTRHEIAVLMDALRNDLDGVVFELAEQELIHERFARMSEAVRSEGT